MHVHVEYDKGKVLNSCNGGESRKAVYTCDHTAVIRPSFCVCILTSSGYPEPADQSLPADRMAKLCICVNTVNM